jgi:hypothetical protein
VMAMVLLFILAIFSCSIALMIQFIGVINRVLSPYALSTNRFISYQLFAVLVSSLIKSCASIIAFAGRGSRD